MGFLLHCLDPTDDDDDDDDVMMMMMMMMIMKAPVSDNADAQLPGSQPLQDQHLSV